jgi:hypothetical protein
MAIMELSAFEIAQQVQRGELSAVMCWKLPWSGWPLWTVDPVY